MGVSKQIKKLRLEAGMTQAQLAEKVGVTRATVTQWESGWSQPRMGKVEALAEVFNVPVSFIVDETPSPIRLPGAMPATGTPTAYVPLRGKVHAGKWDEPEPLEETLVAIPQHLVDADPQTYVCVVEGDCMSRVYPEGCLIAVSPNSAPGNGSVAVVSIDYGDAMMRKLFRTSKTLVLSPDSYNDAYDDIVITAEQDHVIEFGGKVVWFQPSKDME